MGWVAFFRARELELKLERLETEVRQWRQPQPTTEPHPSRVSTPTHQPSSEEPSSLDLSTEYHFDLDLESGGEAIDQAEKKAHQTSAPRVLSDPAIDLSFWRQLQDNWMIWLGGGCVGLAGIFLVKYSVEQGLLGPGARIIAGLILGVILHIAAEWLRRNLSHHPSFAALAGGGSITLFATLLSALQMYQLISPGLAFVLMALVALMTLSLALLHGPVLAALGMLGAYAVPLLVSTGSGNAVSALVYSLIISAATLVLLRRVFRPWLWYGVLLGALGWWLITLGVDQANGVRGLYLSLLAYFMLVVSGREGVYDWTISQIQRLSDSSWRFRSTDQSSLEVLVLPSLGLLIVAQALSIMALGFDVDKDSATGYFTLLWQWSPLVIVIALAMRQRDHLAPLPWLLFGLQSLAWLASQVDFSPLFSNQEHQIRLIPLTGTVATNAFVYLAVTAGLFSGLSLWALARFDYRWRQVSLSLACMAPLLSLGLAYSLSEQWAVSWQWSLGSILLGTLYLSWAAKILRANNADASAIWLLLSGHLAYALATAMMLREASLTLALAMLVVSLSWVMQKFTMPRLGWLLKAMVAVVILRLSLNPWLATYPIDVHWSLWSYGGAALCCGAGAWLLMKGESTDSALADLSRWVGAAAMHLLVLFIWTETRYWLYDGDVFSARYDFLEASVNATFFGALALVYYHRGRVSHQLQRVYHLGAYILMAMALTNYVVVLFSTLIAANWAVSSIGSSKLLNLMLLAYATPAVIAYLTYRWFDPRLRQVAALIASIAAFIFISLQIRHLWQASIDLYLPTGSGELYTYSAVWLLLAIGTIIASGWMRAAGPDTTRYVYRGGMALLGLVILKLFLVDMSDLEGLLRVASFMGLGLALLAIAYLHKRLTQAQ